MVSQVSNIAHGPLVLNVSLFQSHELINGVELYDMVWTLNDMSQDDLLNTDTIYVQTGKKSFVVEKDGMVCYNKIGICVS